MRLNLSNGCIAPGLQCSPYFFLLHILTGVVGLASEAAAIAFEISKKPVAALQLLGNIRGVLLGSLYDSRSNFEAVEREHPDLASQFRDLRESLNAPPLPTNDLGGLTGSNPEALQRGDGRREIGKAMEALTQNTRNQPGFEQFLLPPPTSDLLTAAAEGLVVVLNVSQLRCDALIIGSSGIQCLPLPQVNHGDVKRLSTDPVSALSWLWDNIVGPVLDFLGFTTTPTDDQWPRARSVPTGLLSSFLFTLPGITSSLALLPPSTRLMYLILQPVREKFHPRPTTQGQGSENPLTRQAAENLSSSPWKRPLARKALALDEPRTKRNRHSPAPSHGSTHPTQPLESHLLLQDWETGPLTVQSPLDIDLASNQPFLAYLSACGSGQVADDQSVDESIHLSSAFQLAGLVYAGLVYEGLKRDGLEDLSVSAGLHHATRRLRDDWVREVNSMVGSEETRKRGRPAIPLWKVKKETVSVAVKAALWVLDFEPQALDVSLLA
ncbi:hypothetical protein B0T21DRAFT_397559 [Apiosordaria backusii]|uniref:CHAT domain-containing protein n=1 Tax=Apiosordaria backusii TaxID=314023 RepID=A0AA39ZQ13_9PEZI|nr:hypothetical protein B0T21DRAFT_397559 [Apiosordaria backusii]